LNTLMLVTGGAASSIAVTAPVTAAGNIALTTTGTGSDININGAMNSTAGAVALVAGDIGSRVAVNGALSAAGDVTIGGKGGIAVNAVITTPGNATLIADPTAAISAGTGNEVRANTLSASGASIGASANRLNTTVASLSAVSAGGGIYISETNGLTLAGAATGGTLDVQTGNGSLVVSAAKGNGVTLVAGGTASALTLNGAVDAGASDVTLTAGGAVTAAAGVTVSGKTLTVRGSSIGSSGSQLNTSIDTLNANATAGDVYVREQNGLTLADVRATGDVGVTATAGNITVNTVSASNNATLTAGSGAIVDDGNDSTRVSAKAVTLLARSIGAPSTLTGTTLDSKMRLDLDATTLDATATSGGIFIDELNGLASVSVKASGGASGDIELLTATGDLNLLSVSATDTLLLAAGRDILGLPGLGTITASRAELRAGGADPTGGRIGTLSAPLSLQLDAGSSLRMFVPQTIDPNDASRAPATLPSQGVLSTLSLFGAPNSLSVQAGFGQFQGLGDTQFTSAAEGLVRTIQNQTAVVQTVLGLDWASFDPNVSLFGTLDPAVCLPGDQRDEEKGDSGC
jgi:hypothetical protein